MICPPALGRGGCLGHTWCLGLAAIHSYMIIISLIIYDSICFWCILWLYDLYIHESTYHITWIIWAVGWAVCPVWCLGHTWCLGLAADMIMILMHSMICIYHHHMIWIKIADYMCCWPGGMPSYPRGSAWDAPGALAWQLCRCVLAWQQFMHLIWLMHSMICIYHHHMNHMIWFKISY